MKKILPGKAIAALTCAGIIALGALPASALIITVNNPSFEIGSDITPDWTKTGLSNGSGNYTPIVPDLPFPTAGSKVGFINVLSGQKNGFYQSVLPTLSASTLYTFSFDVGNRKDVAGVGDDNLGTVSGFFTVGSAIPDIANAVGTPFSALLSTITDGTFTAKTATFDTAGFGGSLSQELRIAFALSRPASGSLVTQAMFDNVSLTATPEPSSLVLLMASLPIVWSRRRQKSR